MERLSVLVHGALGKMGHEILSALCREPELKAVAAVDIKAINKELLLPDSSRAIPLSSDLEATLTEVHPDVIVDFTSADATMAAVRTAVKHNVNLVIGTTGLSSDNLNEIKDLCQKHAIGAVVAPNFSLAAVVMNHIAGIAARFFDYAEIIEMHHEQKLDAPSGTSIGTAKAMYEAKGRAFSYAAAKNEVIERSRGAEYQGVGMHSIRLPGLLAHQEIILGAPGQTLRIRLDQINREAFMPGIMLAVKKTAELNGAVFGLDKLIDF